MKKSNFILLVDIGIIRVPKDYIHEKCLSLFIKKNVKKLTFFDNRITDEKFSNPNRILKSGEKFHVQAFRSIQWSRTSCSECITFLNKQKAIFVGARGLALVFEQKMKLLEIGYSYHSFEENKEIFPSESYAKLPCIDFYSDHLGFGLTNLDGEFSSIVFLCFTSIN